ncbi:MAG: HEPN domain-containing protein [Chloroflexi bacterium]|nr:HEPN domain-containing protein [Chloroflexota bacterium]
MGPSRRFIEKQLQLSLEYLDDSQALLEQQRLRSSIDRAYYAMHYSAVALPCHQAVRPPKSHSGPANLFGREVVNKGLMAGEFGRMLTNAMHSRSISTYSTDTEVTLVDAQTVFADAERFVAEARSILGA